MILEMVPVAPIITGITLVFTFHMRCISIVRYFYFKIFSASFLITYLSPGIATSINMNVTNIIIIIIGLIMTSILKGNKEFLNGIPVIGKFFDFTYPQATSVHTHTHVCT